MSDLSLFTCLLVVAALVTGILAGHFGWGKRWTGVSSKLHPDYLAGLDFLVTEQPDRALDMFLNLMDANVDTVETHFALGSLYRRRGEVERAIRIHQNLWRWRHRFCKSAAARVMRTSDALSARRIWLCRPSGRLALDSTSA